MFHVPLSCSGDAGARTEDQHRFIVPERCQSPAPHDGLTLRPRQHIQSKKVVKIPTFQIIKTLATNYLRDRGCPLLTKGREAPQARNDGGTPELLATAYTSKKIFRNIVHGRRNTLKTLSSTKETNISRNPPQVTQYWNYLGNPLPNPGAGQRPVRELAENPRAPSNNYYKLFYCFTQLALIYVNKLQ